MSPGEILQWIKFAALVFQFGEPVIEAAIRIYKRIEDAFRDKKSTGAVKAAAFDVNFKKEMGDNIALTAKQASKALENVAKIREGIWQTRPENRGKPAKKAFPGPIR